MMKTTNLLPILLLLLLASKVAAAAASDTQASGSFALMRASDRWAKIPLPAISPSPNHLPAIFAALHTSSRHFASTFFERKYLNDLDLNLNLLAHSQIYLN